MADVVVDELGEVYDEAKLKLAVFNYRKLFGLSYREVMEEPLDEFFINARINEMLIEKERLSLKEKHNG